MRASPKVAAISALALVVASCGGGGSGGSGSGSSGSTGTPGPAPTPAPGAVYAIPALEALSTAEVQRIIAQAVGEAQARGTPAVIAVSDRVGNVLGVFAMAGARPTLTTSRLTGTGVLNDPPIDAQGLTVAAAAGAISKALTGAYLSSSGNAFSTRTASMIVQQHFPPAPSTVGLESGPLFGVQFSQLPCSDVNTRFAGGPGAFVGPKRAPLGLAADPGGFPLYKNGVVVGGIGVMADGDYAFDRNVLDVDNDAEEAIAFAGMQGFAPPDTITADRITVDGTSLRFSDIRPENLAPLKTDFGAVAGGGALVPINGYTAGAIIAGTPYGSEASGFRLRAASEFAFPDAYVLTDGAGANRFPIRGGTDAGAVSQPLSAEETRAVLEEAYRVMIRARAQIRRPFDSRAQVTIGLVDTYGSVLGVVRAPDAPLFGTDVSLQKARTAAFFSNPLAAQQLAADPAAAPFLERSRAFFGDPAVFTGKTAFSARAIGNIARPYFPDGEVGRPEGPLSRPIADFNPFATGLQVALIANNLLQHVAFVEGRSGADTPQQCTQLPPAPTGQRRLANGIQIFPGGVPIYRGSTLVGAIGVSGDGIDQDDMIAFLGTHTDGARSGGVGNAPAGMRADQIVIQVGAGVRLRYVGCPFAPFLDTAEQNVCQGI